MPHQCTNCGRTFADGSKEMLSGCPDCGGNKFQFRPAGATDSAGERPASSGSTPPTPSEQTRTDTPAGTVADRAAPASGTEPDTPTADPDAPSTAQSPSSTPETENGAQANARSEVVSEDEIAAAAPDSAESAARDDADAADSGPAADDTESADPNLDALRQKLNDQFESIRIVSPGQYELNLMELYDREEYIISLREDGRYVIEMPEGWDDR